VPVVPGRAAFPGRLGHPLDQGARRAAAAHRLLDEQVLQVAGLAGPERRVEEVVREADQPPVQPGAEGVQFGAIDQPAPGRLVRLVRLRVVVERLVPAGQYFPRGPVIRAQPVDLDHARHRHTGRFVPLRPARRFTP
jgi:hypothetical protein